MYSGFYIRAHSAFLGVQGVVELSPAHGGRTDREGVHDRRMGAKSLGVLRVSGLGFRI